MIPLKEVIRGWENVLGEKMIGYSAVLGEKMIGYSAITRKACINPNCIFVIMLWDNVEKKYQHSMLILKKYKGRWVLNVDKFRSAISEKIGSVNASNKAGVTNITINYPQWYVGETC
jgi:hypothetical protein